MVQKYNKKANETQPVKVGKKNAGLIGGGVSSVHERLQLYFLCSSTSSMLTPIISSSSSFTTLKFLCISDLLNCCCRNTASALLNTSAVMRLSSKSFSDSLYRVYSAWVIRLCISSFSLCMR